MSIVAEGLTKIFGQVALWQDMSFEVPAGHITAVTGPSGSGKSTLLHCVAGLERPSSGSLTVLGKPVPVKEGRAMQRYRSDVLGYLFQSFALVETSTALENVVLALPAGTKDHKADKAQIALGAVGLTEDQWREPVKVLSGGEQQRVALARLIAKRPPVILADEPTGSLDDANGQLVAEHLRQLANDGAAVMIVTHNMELAAFADTQMVLPGRRSVFADA